MNVRNCKKCGKLFNHISGKPICPACREKLEETFQSVKKYIRDHHMADIKEVSEACDVEPTQIQQWIREERLEFTADSPVKLPCENCGTMIQSGKYCEKCKREMANNLASAIEKPKLVVEERKRVQSTENKMRFLDR
ncbi:MAG: class I tRNA ligase family protein [Lachnospiraceae bacterium]|nr:class I tRNA ligase family protein [Lachnospiraceae bacterium]MBO5144559.1 class I tRNA ligase family protein [Lachnospiraceae bacterium]